LGALVYHRLELVDQLAHEIAGFLGFDVRRGYPVNHVPDISLRKPHALAFLPGESLYSEICSMFHIMPDFSKRLAEGPNVVEAREHARDRPPPSFIGQSL
jgi:hypothetical protein